MGEPIILRMRPTAEAARLMVDKIAAEIDAGTMRADAGVVALSVVCEDLLAEIPAAERRGYEQAITHLRDHEAYADWAGSLPDDFKLESWPGIAADYLSARLTKETTP